MRKKQDFHLKDPTWCRGCGIYSIFDALKSAVVSLGLAPEQMVVITGIGCHGRLNNYFKAYGFHGLHGRVLPVAAGVKLSNPDLYVLGVSGDGDAYSIGLNHFIHATRKNISVTYMVIDNRVYALTQGQTSPTSEMGFVTDSTPYGNKELPLEGPKLALASGATFIARGFSGEPRRLASLIEKGMSHKGFALIDILSPCVTYNKLNTYGWFRKNVYRLEKDSSFDPKNKSQALERINANGKIPTGVIYQEERARFEELVLPEKERPIVSNSLRIDASQYENIFENFK